MKYLKPKSLTWWGGFVPLVSGLVVSLAAGFPSLRPFADAIVAAYGGMSPAEMINLGLIAIGLRGAVS